MLWCAKPFGVRGEVVFGFKLGVLNLGRVEWDVDCVWGR